MNTDISFTHLLNPFPARPGSEHAIASRVTWATLRAAHAHAVEQGVAVTCRAVVLPGDESAIEAPCSSTVHLARTVADIADLKPRRPLPLIGDLLKLGAEGATSSHIVFSNMDIAVQPHFYTALHALVDKLGIDVPFTVARTNIDAALADAPLEKLYVAEGSLGHGYDCFVIPSPHVAKLDLGNSCIGAPHFDQLLYMALDILSAGRVRSFNHEHLTFHLGNDIAWAAMLDYVEHNLAEALAAIERMKRSHPVKPDSAFARLDKGHFRRNARLSSRMLRKVRRIPGFGTFVLGVKRALGRQY